MNEHPPDVHPLVRTFQQEGTVRIKVSYAKSIVSIVLAAGIITLITWANLDRFTDVFTGGTESTGELTLNLVVLVVVAFLSLASLGMVIGLFRRNGMTLTTEGVQIGAGPVIAWTAIQGYAVTRTRGGGDVITLNLDPAAGLGKRKAVPTHLVTFSRNVTAILQQCQQHALRSRPSGTPLPD